MTLQTLMDKMGQQLGMSKLWWKRSKLTEQTMIGFCINPVQQQEFGFGFPATRHPWQETLIRTKPSHWMHLGLERLKMIVLFPMLKNMLQNNNLGLGEKMHYSKEVTQRYQQRHPSPTSKYQFSGKLEEKYHARCLRSCVCFQSHA